MLSIQLLPQSDEVFLDKPTTKEKKHLQKMIEVKENGITTVNPLENSFQLVKMIKDKKIQKVVEITNKVVHLPLVIFRCHKFKRIILDFITTSKIQMCLQILTASEPEK